MCKSNVNIGRTVDKIINFDRPGATFIMNGSHLPLPAAFLANLDLSVLQGRKWVVADALFTISTCQTAPIAEQTCRPCFQFVFSVDPTYLAEETG